MEKLLEHHIQEMRIFREDLNKCLERMQEKLDTLNDFKTETIMSAKWVSMLISAGCGIITLIATLTLEYFLRSK